MDISRESLQLAIVCGRVSSADTALDHVISGFLYLLIRSFSLSMSQGYVSMLFNDVH